MLFSPLIFFGVSAAVLEQFAPDAGRGAAVRVLFGGLAASALFAFGVALRARLQKPRWILERRTGREFFTRPVHSVFGVGVQYLGVVYGALAALILMRIPHR